MTNPLKRKLEPRIAYTNCVAYIIGMPVSGSISVVC